MLTIIRYLFKRYLNDLQKQIDRIELDVDVVKGEIDGYRLICTSYQGYGWTRIDEDVNYEHNVTCD